MIITMIAMIYRLQSSLISWFMVQYNSNMKQLFGHD